MTMPSPAFPAGSGRFTLAHARADHWGMAAKACLDGIAHAAPGCNLGVLYATQGFGANLSSILTFLRGTTRIEHWVGGIAPGLCAGEDEYRDSGTGGALAVMVGGLPEGSFRPFSCLAPGQFQDLHCAWAAAHGPCVGLVHADPRTPAAAAMIAEAAARAFLVGGFMASDGPPAQLADTVTSGGLSGLLLGDGIEVVAGLTQGCTPIGRSHLVTEAREGVVMTLDGRPALEVLKEEAGELIARDLRRAAGYIHVALPVPGSDTGDYVVRTLLGIDPERGWLAVGERVEAGDRLGLVRRDANSAQADLTRMVAEIRQRLAGRTVRAGFYVSCIARGAHMFGHEGAEMAILRRGLGDIPLIGFYANGEINRDRLYGYTGVLALLPGEME